MSSYRFVILGLVVSLVVFTSGCNSSVTPPTFSTPVATTPVEVPNLPPFFSDVTAKSGVNASYRNGEDTAPANLTILESLGGGGGVIDFDGDGLLDLFFVGGGHFGGPDKKQILGATCKLYRNKGDSQFEDVTQAVGLDTLAGGQPWFYSHGVAIADYDRDGWPDILVTGWGRVALFHNIPDGKGGRRFVDVSAEVGLADGITWATSAAWADLDGDGFPDLYICQYVDWSFANHPVCNYDGKTPDVCPPKKFKGLTHKVFHNIGGTKFNDVSAEAGLAIGTENTSKGLGVLVIDVNQDGKPDIYVANDTVPKFLYVNQSERGKIRLSEKGLTAGVALDGSGSPNGSMGLDAADPEGTGKPALWVTNYENELHALYRNISTKERVQFLFTTPSSGIAAIGQKFVGWGTGFADFDHDGWEDLFIADGHAIRFPTGATRRQRPVLMQNKGAGKFVDVSTSRGGSYFQGQYLSRGAMLADLNNDGKVDIVVVNVNEPAAILQNVAPPGNHWVGVDLVGANGSDIVGARIILEANGRTQTRFAKGGGSYASSPDRRHVFGLGTVGKVAKLTVVWPDETRSEWQDIPTDRYHVVVQGESQLRDKRVLK